MRSLLPLFSLARAVLIVAAPLFVVGCARVYDVKVDAIRTKQASTMGTGGAGGGSGVASGGASIAGASAIASQGAAEGARAYRIENRDAARNPSDPTHQEATALVRNALGGRGMYEAPNPGEAEVVISIDYDVGPARRTFRRPLNENIPWSSAADPIGSVRGVIPPPLGVPTISSPKPGDIVRTDGRVELEAVIIFEKRLSIAAREAPPERGKKPGRELWRVEVSIEDTTEDIRPVLPILVGAAVDNMDRDTHTKQTRRVADNAEPVEFVKQGM